MGPELWILIGAGAVLSCLGLGFWAGWSLGASALELCTLERDMARDIADDLRDQARTSRDAGSTIIEAERSLAASAGLGPAGLVRLLNPDGSAATATPGRTDSPGGPNVGSLESDA